MTRAFSATRPPPRLYLVFDEVDVLNRAAARFASYHIGQLLATLLLVTRLLRKHGSTPGTIRADRGDVRPGPG